MAEFGPTSLFASEFKNVTFDIANWPDFEKAQHPNIPMSTKMIIFNVIIFTFCILGLLGNGKVIWILGFHMKRNSFSIYVLNLAVADCGILIMKILTQISEIQNPYNFRALFILNLLSFVLYNTSQLLLISISVDRCVSVLFPIWHQCHRPPKLSLIVCIVSWVLPLVFFVLELVVLFHDHFLLFQLIFSWLISYPLMVISSLILLLKIFFKHPQQKQKRVLKVSLLALMCFIVLHLPLSIFSVITYSIVKNRDLSWVLSELFTKSTIEYSKMVDSFFNAIYNVHDWFQHMFILGLVSNICITVNSSINPILYFLAGRKKEDQSRVCIKLALHRVFRNE